MNFYFIVPHIKEDMWEVARPYKVGDSLIRISYLFAVITMPTANHRIPIGFATNHSVFE